MKATAAGCEIVYHLAGKAHAVTERRGDEEDYRAVKTEGTRHMLEGAVSGGKIFCVLQQRQGNG